METQKKGFTLIELLIVIGIIGILAAAVIVVLNPAELLAQARDGTRLSDIDSVSSAINLYIASVDAPQMVDGAATTTFRSQFGTTCGFSPGSCTANTITLTDGTGWVAVKLNDVAGGSPLPVLPTDPTNDANYHYAYAGDDGANTFEVNGRLESTRHRGKMIGDGGDDDTCTTYIEATCWYEKGTDPGLNL
jgi:prepilin-type N-terminal cleavage/methylation domain-containing protein